MLQIFRYMFFIFLFVTQSHTLLLTPRLPLNYPPHPRLPLKYPPPKYIQRTWVFYFVLRKFDLQVRNKKPKSVASTPKTGCFATDLQLSWVLATYLQRTCNGLATHL